MTYDAKSTAGGAVEGVQFLTVREIADLAKSVGFKIRTMRGWEREARRLCWDGYGPNCFRDIGGERAYHMMLLPRALRKALAPPKPDMKALVSKRAEACARARQRILTRLDEYQTAHGLSRKAAALAFVGAVKVASLKKTNPAHTRIEGFDLPYTVIRDAKGWVGKGKPWLVSPRTLYQWIADARSDGCAVRVPRMAGDKETIKDLLTIARFCNDAPDEMLDVVASLFGPRFLAAMRRQGYLI